MRNDNTNISFAHQCRYPQNLSFPKMYSVKIYMIKLFSPLYYVVDLSNAMVYAIIYSEVIAMDLYKDMS